MDGHQCPGQAVRAVPEIRSPRNLLGGVLLIALAALALWQAQDLPMGRAMRMGPGYFPRVLAFLIGGCGIALVVMSLVAPGGKLERWSWGRIGLVLAAIVFFAFAIRALGLVVTGVGLVAIATVAAPDWRWKEATIFGVVLVAFAAVLFPKGLGLPLQLWPWP